MATPEILNAFRALKTRVMMSVARGVIGLVDDARKLQSVQISLLADESRDTVERFQNYGMSSNPHPGAEGVMVCVGGNREHGLIIAVDDRRYRIKALEQGEVCIYTDEGDKIHLKRGNQMEVTTGTFTVNASQAINLNAPTITGTASSFVEFVTPFVEASGAMRAIGDITDTYGANTHTMGNMRDIYNSHTHDENDSAPNPTNPPNELME
jgi:phage baseplate assembly protein V